MNDPRLPEIGEFVRGVGRLVSVVEPMPLQPPPKDWIFEDVSARGELRRNGKVLKEFNTYSDFYGLGTSITEAIKEAEEYVAEEGITPESGLEVVVVKIISYARHRPQGGPGNANVYDAKFVNFKSLDNGACWDVPEEVETDVWSSVRGDLREAESTE